MGHVNVGIGEDTRPRRARVDRDHRWAGEIWEFGNFQSHKKPNPKKRIVT